MKNKKAMQTSVVVSLVLIILVLALLIAIYLYTYKPTLEGESNVNAVKNWVWALATKQKIAQGALATERPPVTYLNEPIVISSEEQLKKEAVPVIADSIYDCARAFHFGKLDFMGGFKEEVFCFQCRAIKFSDTIKSKYDTITGITNYMDTFKPFSSGLTYSEMFNKEAAEKQNLFLITEKTAQTSIHPDALLINEDLYIYTIATKETNKIRALKSTETAIGTSVTGGAVLLISLFHPLGWVGLAATILGGPIYDHFMRDPHFKLMVFVGRPSTINTMCNAKFAEQVTT